MEQQNQQPNQQLNQIFIDEQKRKMSKRINIALLAFAAVLIAVGGIFLLKAFQVQPLVPPVIQQTPSLERIIPDEAPIGAEVSVIGSGFTPTKNSLQFGYGEFDAINNLASSDGKKITFTVPLIFDGCNAKGGMCIDLATRPVPGQTYEIAVINVNGTSNRVKFTIAKDITSSEIDTSDWQTYRNEEFGFEFQYSSDWNLKDLQDSVFLTPVDQQSQGAQSGAILWVSAFPLEKEQDFKEILINNTTQGECSDCHPSIDEFTVIQVGNSSFYYIFHYLSEGQFGVLYYKIGSRSVIRLALTATTVANNWLEQALNETYDVKKEPSHIFLKEILSTFRFVDFVIKVPPGHDANAIDVKFKYGTKVDPAIEALPHHLQTDVKQMEKFTNLPSEELKRIGASQFELWFRIQLKEGVDSIEFMNDLRSSHSVESADFVPKPQIPPNLP